MVEVLQDKPVLMSSQVSIESSMMLKPLVLFPSFLYSSRLTSYKNMGLNLVLTLYCKQEIIGHCKATPNGLLYFNISEDLCHQ